MFQQRDGLLWWSASFQKCAVTWVTGSHTSVRITGLPLGKAGLPGRVEPQDFTAACLSSTVFPAPFLWPPALGTDFNYSKYCIPMHKLFLCQPHFLTLLLASSFSKKPKKKFNANFKGYLTLTVITKYWLCSPRCAKHPWAHLAPNNLCLLLSQPYPGPPPSLHR